MNGPSGITEDELKNRFSFHGNRVNTQELYPQIRTMAYSLAEYIVINTKPSREQSLAITKIEEAVFWANAGIARE